MPLTGRPQPRGALVIAQDALDHKFYETSEASVIVARLKARGWEVMLADQKLAVTAIGQDERRRMDRQANALIDRLPAEVRDEIHETSEGVSRPWQERIQPVRSLPDLQDLLKTVGSPSCALLQRAGSSGETIGSEAFSTASAPPLYGHDLFIAQPELVKLPPRSLDQQLGATGGSAAVI